VADYGLRISRDLKTRLDGCRASTRRAIRERLQDIVVAAGKSPQRKQTSPKEPPFRFYVYEGFRVSYQVDAGTRRVVLLDLARVDS
jgi:mRNA-degrading endonuclease RelE of RelBE toxin-antitoxin system